MAARRGLRWVRWGIGSGGVGAPGAAADGTGVMSVRFEVCVARRCVVFRDGVG